MAWSDFEDSVAKKAKKLKEGVDPSIDNAQTATINALNRLSGNPTPPSGSASTPDTAADQAASDANFDKVQQMMLQKEQADREQNPQNYVNPKNYAEGGEAMSNEKQRFSHLKEMMKKHKKAQSELIASKDPMKFIRDNKSMSIKNKKGVAV